jgi:hypothetical protein
VTANSAYISASVFRLSPLIRITLLSLYIALTVPLPFLSQVTAAPVPPELLWIGIGIGLVALYAVLTEQVMVDDEGIQVTYPAWVPHFFRKGWVFTLVTSQRVKTPQYWPRRASLLLPQPGWESLFTTDACSWICPFGANCPSKDEY